MQYLHEYWWSNCFKILDWGDVSEATYKIDQ